MSAHLSQPELESHLWGAATLLIGVVIYFCSKLGAKDLEPAPIIAATLPPSEPLPPSDVQGRI